MPAVIRGAAKAPKGGQGKGAASRRTPPAAIPSKLGSEGVGLQPRIALAAAGAVVIGGLALALATGGRAHAIQSDLRDAMAGGLANAGLRVANVEVEGASRFSAPYIVRAAGIPRNAPLMSLDLGEIQRQVQSVGWVKSVRILRLLPDTIVLAVAERPRLAVWQDHGQAHVIDPDGDVIPEADPGLFVDLPLVVGNGAPQAAGAVMPLLQSRPRLMSRLDALVRVDGRRWDLRLKDGGLIQLPALNPDSALLQLDQLDQKSRLLDLGFERIDLRDPEMVVVRPRQAASTPPAPSKPAPAASAVAPAKT